MVHAWTHVDLNDPGVEILIYHEIIAYHLKESLFACDTSFAGFDAPNYNIFYFFLDDFPFIKSYIIAKGFHVPHAVVDNCGFVILLDGIVGEMHEFVMNVVETILVAAKTKVALFVKPDNWRIVVLDENPLSDVKFFTIYQQRILYVFLDHELAVFSQAIVGNIIEVVETFDTSASRQNYIIMGIQLGLAIHTFLNPLILSCGSI